MSVLGLDPDRDERDKLREFFLLVAQTDPLDLRRLLQNFGQQMEPINQRDWRDYEPDGTRMAPGTKAAATAGKC